MRRGAINDNVAGVLAAIAILVVAVAHSWVAVQPPAPAVSPAPPAVVAPVAPGVPPATTPSVPRADPELIIVTDASGKRITDKAIEEVSGKLAIGQWRIEAIPKPGDTGWQRWIVVSDESKPPPVPPAPTPPVVGPPVVPPVVVPPVVTPTAATYVYEKDDTVIPAPVLAALDKLNREKKIIANPFEQDTKDGQGEVPDQYKVPLQAAKAAGLPALVITAGATVLKVVKNPKTEAEVMEAIAL